MKKILAFAGMALVATTMQAASIAWGGTSSNSANTNPGWEGWAEAGTVYTLIQMGATDPGTPSSFDPATGKTDKGGTAVATYTLTDEDANAGQWAAPSYVESQDTINGWYVVTVYDPVSKQADFKKFEVSGATDTGQAFNTSSAMAGLGANMGSIAAVPEPCSVALLALGLAALGLKRKVA